jgi:CheY-like chemotaxis protein
MATILVIDDELPLRALFRHALERLDYAVVEASGGQEGLRCCQTRQIDLAVVDFALPDMGGLELLRTLRTLVPAMKILVVSGGGRLGALDVFALAMEAGADLALQKPILVADLQKAVQELLAEP